MLRGIDEPIGRYCGQRPLPRAIDEASERARLATGEVDVFSGENDGLIVAEVELESEDQAVVIPNWIGEEVADDPRT